MGRSNKKTTCMVCNKQGHQPADCRLLKAVNASQKQQQKGKSQQNGKQQQPKTKNCNHCGKAGHIRSECFILNPSLKHQPKGQQQQQQGGKKKCTFCHKGGHSAEECFKANPELRSQQGKNKQQQELRCSYCIMPDHNVDGCYLLHPELRNPFLGSQQQPQEPWMWLGNQRNDNNNEAPPPRLTRRIKEAEALALDLTPPEIQRHSNVQRIQGWYPARQAYYTLPLYGAVVDRPVKYTENPFTQALDEVAYEAFDTSGDLIMCSCGSAEGHGCNLEHWVREVVESDGPFRFWDSSEEGFARIMSEGLVDHAAAFTIH